MDIEVKNSLERLLMISQSIESHLNERNFSDCVIEDVFAFINVISKSGAEERISSFGQIYLKNRVQTISEMNFSKAFPDSLQTFCKVDEDFESNGVQTSEIFLSFIVVLGKYYRFSRFDKNDIDTQKMIVYLKQVKEYVDSHTRAFEYSNQSNNQKNINQNSTISAHEKQIIDNEENIKSEMVEESEETIEVLLQKLYDLIGLEGVKKEVNSLINMQKVAKRRKERGLPTADVSKHLVFLGNPGTGKTTVARLIAKIYKQLGVLEKGQLVEVDRAGLVAGYVGQTALKTKEKIDEAMGGILFIDEAYTLAKGGNDFGQEAIDTVLKAMEDNRDKFVVIVAGYLEPMNQFLQSNPGLKSRFNKSIFFEDYSETELYSIFEQYCKKYAMEISDGARKQIVLYLHKLYSNKPVNFANGREMRNMFEKIYEKQAGRVALKEDISDFELNEITEDDLPAYCLIQ